MAEHTKLSVLLFLMEDDIQISYWFPKSQLELRKTKTGLEVVVSQWAWMHRKPAKPMGCH